MSSYERIYDVNLLDDLHNFFPALLYQPASFRTVQDVLGYVRQRTTQRFNLFDYGRRQFERSNSVLFPNPAAYYAPQQRMPAEPVLPEDEVISLDFTASLLPLLQSLRHSRTVATAAVPTYNDVVVHASQTMVNDASTEETLQQDLETNCAICQDRMRQGEHVRKLTVCQHTFHTSCIDVWLLHRSVRCPTCRHDIRDPALPVAPAVVAPAAARTQANRSATTAELVSLIFGGSTD